MTATELVLASTPNDIANLPAEQRGQMITHALIESKSWLALATKGTDPTPIAEFKAWAATVAEMTKQKGLAAEIQADALEMVRRAERGIGVAIRNGQEAGEIRALGVGGGPRADYQRAEQTVHVDPGADDTRISPKDFFADPKERRDVYAVTDGVSEEHFEEALTQARSAGNLSRANVIREVQAAAKPERLTPAERLNMIGDMADAGHTSDQIAKAVGHTEDYVRRLAKENGINIPADKVMRGTKRINHTKFVAETVTALEGLASGLDILDLSQVDESQIEYWATSLTDSLRALNRLAKQIKEMTQ